MGTGGAVWDEWQREKEKKARRRRRRSHAVSGASKGGAGRGGAKTVLPAAEEKKESTGPFHACRPRQRLGIMRRGPCGIRN